MRAMLGDENFRDVEAVVHKLSALVVRGAISSEWHSHMLEQLADELVTQQIANDVANGALTDDGSYPDASTTEAR